MYTTQRLWKVAQNVRSEPLLRKPLQTLIPKLIQPHAYPANPREWDQPSVQLQVCYCYFLFLLENGAARWKAWSAKYKMYSLVFSVCKYLCWSTAVLMFMKRVRLDVHSPQPHRHQRLENVWWQWWYYSEHLHPAHRISTEYTRCLQRKCGYFGCLFHCDLKMKLVVTRLTNDALNYLQVWCNKETVVTLNVAGQVDCGSFGNRVT